MFWFVWNGLKALKICPNSWPQWSDVSVLRPCNPSWIPYDHRESLVAGWNTETGGAQLNSDRQKLNTLVDEYVLKRSGRCISFVQHRLHMEKRKGRRPCFRPRAV